MVTPRITLTTRVAGQASRGENIQINGTGFSPGDYVQGFMGERGFTPGIYDAMTISNPDGTMLTWIHVPTGHPTGIYQIICKDMKTGTLSNRVDVIIIIGNITVSLRVAQGTGNICMESPSIALSCTMASRDVDFVSGETATFTTPSQYAAVFQRLEFSDGQVAYSLPYSRLINSNVTATAYYAIPPPNLPPVITGLTPSQPSPQNPGTLIQWRADAYDPEGDIILYRFFVKPPAGTWTVMRDWDGSAYFNWIPQSGGTYEIAVHVRDQKHADANGFDDHREYTGYVITAPAPNQPPTAQSLTPDTTGPYRVGKTINFHAVASDPEGDTLWYRFWLRKGTAPWTIALDWNTNPYMSWNPPDAGTYDVSYWVRDGKHAAIDSFDAHADILGLVVQAAPPPANPQISLIKTTYHIGEDITFTGTGFTAGGKAMPAITKDHASAWHYGDLFTVAADKTVAGGLVVPDTVALGQQKFHVMDNDSSTPSPDLTLTISEAPPPPATRRYMNFYARLDEGTPPVNLQIAVANITKGLQLGILNLSITEVGKRICVKASYEVNDTDDLRARLFNNGPNAGKFTWGVAQNAATSITFTVVQLASGGSSNEEHLPSPSIYSQIDFDWTGCEGIGPPPGSECEQRFPNRGTPLSWDAIGYALCIVFTPLWSIVAAFLKPIFDTWTSLISPLGKAITDAGAAVTSLSSGLISFLADPWTTLATAFNPVIATIETPLKNYWDWVIARNTEFFKPLTDALAVGGPGVFDWLTPFKEWLENLPDFFTGWVGWLTKPEEKIVETIGKFTAQASPSGYESMLDYILKTYFGVMGNPVGDFVSAPIENIRGQIEERIRKFQGEVIELANTNKDDPSAFTDGVIEAGTGLDMEMYAWSILLELMSLGQVDAPNKLLEIVQSYSGPGVFSKLHMEEAIRNSVALASRHYWADKFRMELPGTGDVINQVVKEIIPLDEFKRIMGLRGFSDEQAQRVWDAHFIAPARDELVTALRRGKISREAWNRLKVLVDLDPRYDRIDADTGEAGTGSFSIWDDMIYTDPGISNLRFMFESGSVTADELPTYIQALGYRREHIPAMVTYITEYQSRFFRRRQLTLLARLQAAGKITEDEFITRAAAIYYTKKTARYELENQELSAELGTDTTERATTLGLLNAWYTEDIIDAATYRDSAHALPYSDETIDHQLAYLDKKKAPIEPPVTEREASRAMYDTYYMNDLITPEGYKTALQELRYSDAIITLQLAYLDQKKAPPPTDGDGDLTTERDLLQSEAIAAFKKRVIDELTLRDRLDKLGRSQDAIDVLVAMAKLEMATTARDASQAIYSKAYRQGAIDRPTYKLWLTSQEYTDEAAELIIQTDELSWATGVETLTQTQILNSWELGFIDDEHVQLRLKATGLSDTDMRVLLSNSVLDQLKAKHLTNAEADKKWTDFGVGPDERANLLKWYGWTVA